MAFPQRVHGLIFWTKNGSAFSCSGTVIPSARRNLIVTAGHCMPPEAGGNYVFVPGYRYGDAPLGVWGGVAFYANDTNPGPHDVGIVKFAPNPSGNIEDAVGSRGFASGLDPVQTFNIFGYPARPNPDDDGFGDYDGERLIRCRDATSHVGDDEDGNISDGDLAIGAAYCFMQHGSSGGGWVIGDGDGVDNSWVNSVVSYGYCQEDPDHTVWDPETQTGVCGLIFGPYFGDAVEGLYSAAQQPACSNHVHQHVHIHRRIHRHRNGRRHVHRIRHVHRTNHPHCF